MEVRKSDTCHGSPTRVLRRNSMRTVMGVCISLASVVVLLSPPLQGGVPLKSNKKEPTRTRYNSDTTAAELLTPPIQLSDLPLRRMRYMMLAYLEAAKSVLAKQHGAVIVKNGNVVARGHNRETCSTQRARFSRHAEEDALRNCPPHHLRDADLYVV
ncbi:hypothetical protein AAMO2058_001549800, partial [Amorphochlora amoebiformis]